MRPVAVRVAVLACIAFAAADEPAVEEKAPDLSVKAQPGTKVYQDQEAFYVHGPGLGASEHPVFETLVEGTDFTVTSENLKKRARITIQPGRNWGEPGEVLTVEKTVKEGADVWVADDPVRVAYILATPEVDENDEPIGAQAKRLFIEGFGFNPKHTYLTFGPEDLQAGEDYSISIEEEELILTLKQSGGKLWGAPGPLKIVSIDTGAGPKELDVTVATIVGSDHPSAVAATVTRATTPIYASRTRSLTITGSGFSEGQYIGFMGGCADFSVEFTVEVKSESEIELTLKPGKEWCIPDEVDQAASGSLPLLVRSVSTNEILPKAVQVATVFLDPAIEKNDASIMVEGTRTLEIDGDGFVPGKTVLTFDPPLTKGVDYEQFVEKQDELDITLLDGKKWSNADKFPHPLKVLSIDTGAGPVELAGGAGVVVGTLIKGAPAAQSVVPSNEKVYMSAGRHWLVVKGSGFDTDPSSIELGKKDCHGNGHPEVVVTGKHMGNNQVNVSIPPDAEWCSYGGPLFLRSMTFGSKTTSFVSKGKTEGVQIAYVLYDPDVEADEETVVFETHTKTIVLDVDGVPHTDEVDVEVKLDPPHAGKFTHAVTLNDELVLHLKPGEKWTGNAEGKLMVKQVNTGAGWVHINSQVAIVQSDAADGLCSDTCEWPDDGFCDDTADEYAIDSYGGDDDYNYFSAPCAWGTDCKDCGPRQPVTLSPTTGPTVFAFDRCDDDCDGGRWANDGECDDGRVGSFSFACDLGSDCTDCGAIPSNEKNDQVDLLDARMCADGLYGTAVIGDRCVFPFTYNGVEMNSCSHEGVAQAAVQGWCATTADYDADQEWGSCAYCYDVNAEIEYYYDPYAAYYYEYQYQYEEYSDEQGNTGKKKTKVQTKIAKSTGGAVDPHGSAGAPSSSSVGGSVAGIFGLLFVGGAAFFAYKRFAAETGGTGYDAVPNRDLELAGMPMRNTGSAQRVPITPDIFKT